MGLLLSELEFIIIEYLKTCDTYNGRNYSTLEDISNDINISIVLVHGAISSLVRKRLVVTKTNYFSLWDEIAILI